MTNKKGFLVLLIVSLTLFVSVLTSCHTQSQAAVKYENTEKQEWLASLPNKLIVTDLTGQEKEVSIGFKKNAVLNTLKSIRLDKPLQAKEEPVGSAYCVRLQYSNGSIYYTFHETELWLTVNGENAKAYQIDDKVWDKIEQQLQEINPS